MVEGFVAVEQHWVVLDDELEATHWSIEMDMNEAWVEFRR